MQLDDELFSTDSSLALFRAIGTTDKRLYLTPGRHRDVPPEAFHFSIDFLAANLQPLSLDAEVAG